MNEDIENELKESPELSSVVARLRNSAELEPHAAGAIGVIGGHKGPTAVWLVRIPFATLLAASLLVALAFALWFNATPTFQTSQACSYGAREYHQTPAEMIASQNADGSWQNDFLTRRNAEVLRSCEIPGAQMAYKKAMRNLRSRGIL